MKYTAKILVYIYSSSKLKLHFKYSLRRMKMKQCLAFFVYVPIWTIHKWKVLCWTVYSPCVWMSSVALQKSIFEKSLYLKFLNRLYNIRSSRILKSWKKIKKTHYFNRSAVGRFGYRVLVSHHIPDCVCVCVCYT